MNEGYAAWATRWRVPLGFALGAVYLIFSQPSAGLLAIGAAVGFVGLLLRGAAAGCLNKNQNLATSGPYAYTRNPLYLGSLIMGVGLAIAGGSWILALAVVSLFIAVYWPVMRREETYLRRQFGEAYTHYANAVPFFIPRLRPGIMESAGFHRELYRQNREYEAALGFLAGVAFLCAKMMLR